MRGKNSFRNSGIKGGRIATDRKPDRKIGSTPTGTGAGHIKIQDDAGMSAYNYPVFGFKLNREISHFW